MGAGLGRGNDPKNVKKEKSIGAAGKLMKTFPVFDSITSAIEKQESKGLTLGWRFIVATMKKTRHFPSRDGKETL